MAREQQSVYGPGKGRVENGRKDRGEGGIKENECRCKEVANKTLPEMLKLMLSDLMFWKKPGKRR